MKQLIIGLILVFIFAGVIFSANYFFKPPNSSPPSSTNSAQITPPESAKNEVGVKVIEVEAGSFYYKPNEIIANRDQKIKIVLKSVSMMHDFNIDELGVKMPIVKNGDTGTVEFIASKIGTFEYYCSVGQHRKMGQVGKIIIK